MRTEVLCAAALNVLFNYITFHMVEGLDRLPCAARNAALSRVLRATIVLFNLFALGTVAFGHVPPAVQWIVGLVYVVFDLAFVIYLSRVHDDHNGCAAHAPPVLRASTALLYYTYLVMFLVVLMNASLVVFLTALRLFYTGRV